jgi:uncharacterized membrane protein
MNRRGKRVMIARVRGRPARLLGAALIAAALGCGSEPSSCPHGDFPTSCPAMVPSFSADVLPIFQAKCDVCHAPGGQRAETPLTTWSQITQVRLSTVVQYVQDCKMPLAPVPALTPEERKTMLDWFVCMTPNN